MLLFRLASSPKKKQTKKESSSQAKNSEASLENTTRFGILLGMIIESNSSMGDKSLIRSKRKSRSFLDAPLKTNSFSFAASNRKEAWLE